MQDKTYEKGVIEQSTYTSTLFTSCEFSFIFRGYIFTQYSYLHGTLLVEQTEAL